MNDDTDAAAIVPVGGGTTEHHVIPSGLFRARGRRVTFAEEPPGPTPPPPAPARRPAKVARMLALAHHVQWAIDRGEVADAATVARRLGVTRARVSQLLDLCPLAPEIQEGLLWLDAVDGAEPMAERALRGVVRAGRWERQRAGWARVRP